MSIYDKVIIYQHKAQYYETDQMGCVHHSNYIRWFEEARTDLLEQVGFSYKRMEEEGILSPVLEVRAEYKSMVRYQDIVNILAKVTFFNGVKFTISYQIADALTKEVKTIGESKHCFLNKELKPMRLQKENKEVYELFLSMSNHGL
jgi:acyl-CoA thioester hydrolase